MICRLCATSLPRGVARLNFRIRIIGKRQEQATEATDPKFSFNLWDAYPQNNG